jgi:recombinational DNA repair protein (RecF pathway)
MTVRVIGDFSTPLYLLGVVDVYRRCRECGQHKTLGAFPLRRGHVCSTCYRAHKVPHVGRNALTRSITITDLGRADLRAWKEAQG